MFPCVVFSPFPAKFGNFVKCGKNKNRLYSGIIIAARLTKWRNIVTGDVIVYHFGTKSNDLFRIDGANLVSDYVNGRRGYDILQIESDGDYHFSTDSYGRLRRIEEINFSQVEGNLSIDLNASMLNQAKRDTLTMSFASSNPVKLKAADYGFDTLG